MKRNGQGQIKTCRRKQHVKTDGMKGIPNLFCGIFAVGGNYNLTRDKHIVIPVGCTGYMAQKLWEQINLNIEKYYGKVSNEVLEVFQCLNTKMSNEEIVSNIIKLIKLLRR